MAHCKAHERTHSGGRPRQCKHLGKSVGQLGTLNKHKRTHVEGSSVTFKQSLKEQATHLRENPQLLPSDVDHRADQLDTFSCWICQEELSSQELLMEHYENHMR